MSSKAQMIAPDAYPQMMGRAQAAQLSQALCSGASAVNATRIIANSAGTLREALLGYVEALEAAGQDQALVSDKAHEIKGFADTAGLPATARIAEGLCHYLGRTGRRRRHRPACQRHRPRHPRQRPWRPDEPDRHQRTGGARRTEAGRSGIVHG